MWYLSHEKSKYIKPLVRGHGEKRRVFQRVPKEKE
jgi:hypothetical protein